MKQFQPQPFDPIRAVDCLPKEFSHPIEIQWRGKTIFKGDLTRWTWPEIRKILFEIVKKANSPLDFTFILPGRAFEITCSCLEREIEEFKNIDVPSELKIESRSSLFLKFENFRWRSKE